MRLAMRSLTQTKSGVSGWDGMRKNPCPSNLIGALFVWNVSCPFQSREIVLMERDSSRDGGIVVIHDTQLLTIAC